ncbi:sulfite exporter TauE/SafE family protein [Arcobacter lanthieri]|uniref:sulfite exporter TauE/SafE family protein n=1 Tax=Aliarcobacter lanthieri TaxID=1355374 RepID=UPI001922F0EA|nr:sulfite exporter TauE/SafE family protein [Aliarcobacter lanthieri]MBL3519205.1 sulfite exporter TauE/SafE family protein [Aliarcobacter lanthieri]
MEFTTEFLIFASVVIFFSSLVQATISFGFPMIATPILAMATDMKTAVIYVAIPTLLLNISALLLEKNFLQAIKRFYPLAIFAMIGSAIGTQILIYSNSEIFKFLLAISILFYLFSQKFSFSMPWVLQKPKLSTTVFGLSAGIIGGLTNVMALVLIIYALESKHSKKEIIQSSNLCFMFGKIIQIILFTYHGSFSPEILEISLYNLLIVLICIIIGLNLKNKIKDNNYNKVIKGFLFVMAIALIYQTLF